MITRLPVKKSLLQRSIVIPMTRFSGNKDLKWGKADGLECMKKFKND